MPDPDFDSYAHPAPVHETSTETCPDCGNTWDVKGYREYGNWSPIDEIDLICPDCGKNVLED